MGYKRNIPQPLSSWRLRTAAEYTICQIVTGVRLIPINDGMDSAKGDDDFTPFCNIMNEFYAGNTKRKIKSVFKAKGMTGQVPYGCLWADETREQWVIDEEVAAVVRQIFSLTMEGFGPYQISRILTQQKVEIPASHLARHGEGVNKSKTFKIPLRLGLVNHCPYLQKA